MNTEKNCQSCKYYKDGYCENLELKPYYPQKGCDDFSKRNELKKGMIKEELKFIDDKVFVYTPLSQYGAGVYEVQLVMTKEIFQECYKRWIEPQERSE